MPEQAPSIYRESALKQYIQGRERDVLPRLVSPPAFLLLWLLMGFSLVCGVLAWSVRVPVYLAGTGIIFAGNESEEVSAVIFVPAAQQARLHPGELVQLNIGPANLSEAQRVTAVAPGPLSPARASQLYGLTGPDELALLVQGPVVAVVVKLNPTLTPDLYAGTMVRAQIQIGSQRLLALLPLIGNVAGGE